MTVFWIVLFIWAVFVAFWIYAFMRWREAKRRQNAVQNSYYGFVCDRCAEPLTLETHHKIWERPDDELERMFGSGMGTAMVADFCPEHCEGGCNRGCEPKPMGVGEVSEAARRPDGDSNLE